MTQEENAQLIAYSEEINQIAAKLEQATQLIASFAQGANMAQNLIAKLQADLVESKRREVILLNAINRLRTCNLDTNEVLAIASKAWDEARPRKQ